MLARAEVSPDVQCVYAALSILGAVFEAMPRGVGISRVTRRTKPSVKSSEVVMMVGCQEDAGQFGNRGLEPCGRRAFFRSRCGEGKNFESHKIPNSLPDAVHPNWTLSRSHATHPLRALSFV